VQTDVMVFDKQGHFVPGLKLEQFALKIDSKPQPVSFLEEVTSGNSSETKGTASRNGATPTRLPGSGRRRTVFFFIDDFHLAPTSLVRTRKALMTFIDGGMLPNDQVAITSASGQIGFLQQITDDKIALRAAVGRLNYRGVT